MPSVSEAQQNLFAIAEHKPSILKSKNKKLAGLSHKVLHEFAATKTKMLPKKVSGKKGPKK